MGRPTAAEKAAKELAELQKKKAEGTEGTEGGQEATGGESGGTGAIAQGGDDLQAGGDSGAGKAEPEPEADQVGLIPAVALRDIPGTIIKNGQIIKAPTTLIKNWDARNWIDDHENALDAAAKKFEAQALADPSFVQRHQLVLVLDECGAVKQEVIEE